MISTMMRLFPFLISLMMWLTGCNLSEATPVPVVQATRPYIVIASSETQAPSPTRLVRDIPTLTPTFAPPTAEPTASAFTCGVVNDGLNTQHHVEVVIDYRAKRVDVVQQVTYRNDDQVALAEIVFAIEPNSFPNAFDITDVRLAGRVTTYNLSANRLVVPLTVPMNAGCQTEITLTYTLNVPQIGIGLSSFKGYFGYGERQLNLGHWLATVAPRVNNRWVVNQSSQIGEQGILQQANWQVDLELQNAPESTIIAAPGEMTQIDETHWQFVHNNAREFAVSISPNFIVNRATASNGVTIELYHYSDTVRQLTSGVTVDGAIHALQVSRDSFEQYSSLFGAYPYRRLLVVQGDYPDGMEFAGLVYVSSTWFYGYEGGAENYLTVITVHEVSHQWWYAKVGNDSAFAPWLDEALATYSEYVYYEEFYPDLKNWWWSFRVAWYNPQGNVDSAVYEFETVREYINAVYLRGVQMLHNIREDIGTEAFFDLLSRYANAEASQIASNEAFWSLFSPEQLSATRDTRETFLREPDVVTPD